MDKPPWSWCTGTCARESKCPHCGKRTYADGIVHYLGEHWHVGCLLDKLMAYTPPSVTLNDTLYGIKLGDFYP
jgi:hypothetical protein